MSRGHVHFTLMLVFLFCGSVMAQPARSRSSETRPGTASTPTTQKAVDKLSVTEHQVTIGGQAIHYKATAGYLPVRGEDGKEKANFFFVAYERDRGGDFDPATRPMTYVFNGGPGAAAVWLHIGTAGPKRVQLNEQGQTLPPPYRLVDNDFSWLDMTDLVFIDPVGTGFSRVVPGEKGEQFYGVREDISSVAEFIRLYTTKYERWASPKFLAGESYGTTRAAALSEYLLERHGIAVNGIVLISTVLNFQTLSPSQGNELPYPLFLPTYTASAWYHKKLAPELQNDLQKTLREVEQFASGTYTEALAKGANLTDDQRKEVIDKLSRYTGLSAGYLSKSDLRVGPSQFRQMLLEDQRKLIGRFDTRITGFDPNPTNSSADYDPSLSTYLALYTATFNDYVRRELKYENDLQYEVLSDKVHPWNYGPAGRGYLNVADDLRSAMLKNPDLKLMVCSGYFDLATPYWATNYTIGHMDMPKEIRSNITMQYFPGGHMLYHPHAGLEKLKANMAKFIKDSVPSK